MRSLLETTYIIERTAPTVNQASFVEFSALAQVITVLLQDQIQLFALLRLGVQLDCLMIEFVRFHQIHHILPTMRGVKIAIVP
jgi:hypothetical protein